MSQQETVLYPCNECKRFYKSLKSLKKHTTKTHAVREFACFECKKFYIQERILKKHFKEVHPGKDMNDQDCRNEVRNEKIIVTAENNANSKNQELKITVRQIANCPDKKKNVIEEVNEEHREEEHREEEHREKERGFIYSLSEKYILDLLKAENEWVMRETVQGRNINVPYYV